MGILRSEDMYLYKFVVSKDNAYQAIRQLGQIKCTHFIDMNKNEQAFKLPYTHMIKRCEETERRLMYLKKESARYKVKLISPENFTQLDDSLTAISKNKRISKNMLIEEVENEIREKESFVVTQNDRVKTMFEVLNELKEYSIVLDKANKVIHGRLRGVVGESPMSLQSDHDVFGVAAGAAAVKPSGIHSGRRSLGYLESEESKDDISGRHSRLEQSFREISIRYMAGTIDKEDMLRFKRILFRASRGKILSYFEDIETELKDFSGRVLNKVVYVIVFEEGNHFKEKIQKLCDSFQGKRFHLPDGGHGDSNCFKRKISKIQQKINDTLQMIKITRDQMHQYLEEINQAQGVAFSVYEVYRLFIRKEKMIYQVLNQLQSERNLFYGFLWSNYAKHQLMNEIYNQNRHNNPGQVDQQPNIQLEVVNYQKIKPPTFIKTNEFTAAFQEIVNTYGIPNYKEINPAYFACVTFPFLFGIMFGDIGHGLVLFITGLMLCILQPCLYRSQVLKPILQMRYMILLMGLFATFSGIVYNDMMAIPLQIFESCYDSETGKSISNDCVYPIGVDPIWAKSKNELTYMNSLKMKLSVILAVLQMSLGIFMKALNASYFKNSIDFLHEFLPQIILMWVLFGYMDALIIVKWLTNYQGKEKLAPSIITTMINMALNGGKIDGQPLIGSAGVNQAISITFLLIALVTVPWMLFAKPLILKKRNANIQYHQANGEEIEMRDLNADKANKKYEIFVEEEKDNDNEIQGKQPGAVEEWNHKTGLSNNALGSNQVFLEHRNNEELVLELIGQNNHEHFSFSEIFIHQLIETIEFVLGTISNTASYLRLWALSLAHSQLSKVFFENTVKRALINGSAAGLLIGYPVWISATIGVLMSMDVMECFLHTLRLHWVEFQNKFYKGQGYRFVPFSYEGIFEVYES